jgi:hypothetical protein
LWTAAAVLGKRWADRADFDLFGIAGNIPNVEMPDDTDSRASDALAKHRAVVGTGSSALPGSLASCPAITWSISALSAVRVIGPIWSREKASGATPRRLTLP